MLMALLLPQGFHMLGGSSVTHLGPGDMAANAGEEPVDTARLLSRVVDCLVVSCLDTGAARWKRV